MTSKRSIRYEPLSCKTILNEVKAPSMPFSRSLNPYRGCQHGCSFCYARSTHSFLGMETDDTFQNHIMIKENAAAALELQLQTLSRSRRGLAALGTIAIGTATDPYQPIEGTWKLTRQCLEVLQAYGVPYSITTRSPLILRDLDILRRSPGCSVNISVNTLQAGLWSRLEPSTPPPGKRLETVRELADNGIRVGVFMAPLLPYLSDGDDDIRNVIEQAACHRAGFVAPSFLRLSTSAVKVWFFQTLQAAFPHLVEAYAELYVGGTGSLPPAYKERRMPFIRAELARCGFDPEPSAMRGPSHARPQAAANEASDAQPVQLSLF
ncbi:radical SAM protein [Paenibacillus athensensis]|uniref:Radical SAM protein n=1 Tax=Paenibacillus athensensis TaxID=1967502 RepID=A0A4Y8QAG8_9BACL|nr:radical SAM protein [Paenibacillus athensensis]MCD1257596.1 radical SAM protein [Paenibacillus athensensis]